MEQLIDQVLHDRYQIQTLLGRKTGRRTFLANDLETRSPVVIKLMLFGPDFVWDDLKLFEREAETLKALDHPAIPTYLDFFEMDTEPGQGFALVQGYIEARSLQEWVQSGCTFSEVELKAIAKELLDILAYLHSRQPPVIHRDIKPSNILLRNRSGNSSGEVYLVDFGSVQTMAHGGTVTVVGTYGYMPPEQFGGRSLPASDLYSIGATLIYLATGQHPADLPQRDLHIEFAKLANLSHSFTYWIEWLVEPSLLKRIASAKEALEHNFCQHFRPAINETSVSLSNQNFSIGIRRPERSKINLYATPTILEIKVPRKQIDYIFPTKGTVAIGCLAAVILSFSLVSAIGWWAFLLGLVLPIVLYLIHLSRLSADTRRYLAFLRTASSTHLASITFQREKYSIIVTLYSRFRGSDAFVIFRQKLRSLSAGLNTVPEYRLNLDFQDPLNTLVITGTRQEIQWLCDAVSDWTGIQAERWEPPSA